MLEACSKSKHPKPAEAAVTPVTSRRSPLAREAQKIDNNNDIANTNGLIKVIKKAKISKNALWVAKTPG